MNLTELGGFQQGSLSLSHHSSNVFHLSRRILTPHCIYVKPPHTIPYALSLCLSLPSRARVLLMSFGIAPASPDTSSCSFITPPQAYLGSTRLSIQL